jgi:hypothetical protein
MYPVFVFDVGTDFGMIKYCHFDPSFFLYFIFSSTGECDHHSPGFGLDVIKLDAQITD